MPSPQVEQVHLYQELRNGRLTIHVSNDYSDRGLRCVQTLILALNMCLSYCYCSPFETRAS